jgi:hypothetical protein
MAGYIQCGAIKLIVPEDECYGKRERVILWRRHIELCIYLKHTCGNLYSLKMFQKHLALSRHTYSIFCVPLFPNLYTAQNIVTIATLMRITWATRRYACKVSLDSWNERLAFTFRITNCGPSVRKQTIPTEVPPNVGKVSANFYGCRMVSAMGPHGH